MFTHTVETTELSFPEEFMIALARGGQFGPIINHAYQTPKGAADTLRHFAEGLFGSESPFQRIAAVESPDGHNS